MKKFILLVYLVFLTACAAQGNSIKSTDSAKDVPFLTYTRSGGFAGVNESWEFYSDGRMVSNKGEEKKAAAEDAQALMEQLRKADLAAMSKITPSPQNCATASRLNWSGKMAGKKSASASSRKALMPCLPQ